MILSQIFEFVTNPLNFEAYSLLFFSDVVLPQISNPFGVFIIGKKNKEIADAQCEDQPGKSGSKYVETCNRGHGQLV
jgi:hypothetical protein